MNNDKTFSYVVCMFVCLLLPLSHPFLDEGGILFDMFRNDDENRLYKGNKRRKEVKDKSN